MKKLKKPKAFQTEPCDPKDIALKSMFLGPQAENEWWLSGLLGNVFRDWFRWRRSLYPEDGCAIPFGDQIHPDFLARRKKFEDLAQTLSNRFQNEIPKFSPRYIGHMFSEISLPALLGHLVALLHNPNNISGESAKVGVQIENEAIQFLSAMVGYPTESVAGHFTSGGTIANFEALFRAKQRLNLWLNTGMKWMEVCEAAHMGWTKFREIAQRVNRESGNLEEEDPPHISPVVLVPAHKHYSWTKAISLMGLGQKALWQVKLDGQGRLSIPDLKQNLERAIREKRPVLMVVSVAGTTELGTIDPIYEVQKELDHYRKEYGFDIWHHVDAAFGGFFCCLGEESPRHRDLKALALSDSLTIDPHKTGYVPYSSGVFLARERQNYFLHAFGGPYIDFSEESDHGQFTLEGSRSAAGAAATWMTAKSIGLNPEGYGRILARTIQIKQALESSLSGLSIRVAPSGDTNILCFAAAKENEKISETNLRTLAIFQKFSPDGNGEFFVSKTTLAWENYGDYLDKFTSSWGARADTRELHLIRMCLMNPFFKSKEMDVDFSALFVEKLRAFLNSYQEG